jgi:hypothetical protein
VSFITLLDIVRFRDSGGVLYIDYYDWISDQSFED